MTETAIVLSIIVVVLLLVVVASVWLVVYWSLWTDKRNREAHKLRQDMITFVYEDLQEWKEKEEWLNAQPDYAKLVPLDFLAPLTAPPLSKFVVGKYEEEFWRWHHGRHKIH